MSLKLFSKINEVLHKRKALKNISFFLYNGCYVFNGNDFYLEKNAKKIRTIQPHMKCTIFSKNKYNTVYLRGSIKETKYKTVYIFDKCVFYIYKNKKLYLSIKEKYALYKQKLIYDTIDLLFDDNSKMAKTKKVNGEIFNDENHFDLFQNFYLKKIIDAPVTKKERIINENAVSIIYVPQHGDIHKGNVFWSSNTFCLIDLDDIDIYPLFYDLFYSYLSYKHEAAFEVFHSNRFRNNVKTCYKYFDSANESKIDIVDLYLSQYVYFWTNKIDKKTDPFEPYFYLRWFLKADLDNFPLTKSEIKSYYDKIKIYKKAIKGNEKH